MPILFFIFTGRVFDSVMQFCPLIMSLTFVDNLGFIVLGSSVKVIASSLGKIAKIIIEWGKTNAVIYNIWKTEAILFFCSYR